MALDGIEPDLARKGVGSVAPQRVDAQGLKLDLIVQLLHRDDPLRRSYLRKRWQGHRASVFPLSEVQNCNVKRTSLSLLALSRR
jgi:hypothetical protein